MADTYTPNLNLVKDGQDSYYNVDKFNGNLDLIDAAVKAADDKGTAAQSTTDSHKTDPAAHPNGISGNAATATKATQDGNGNNIADTYFLKSGGTVSGDIHANEYYAAGWFKSLGDSGWLNGTHQGGWYMTDDTWIRSFNGKNVYTLGQMKAESGFQGDLAGTATKAMQDGNGANIASTYLPKTGGVITGEIQSADAVIIRSLASMVSVYSGGSNAGIYDGKNSRGVLTYVQGANVIDVGNDAGTNNLHGITHASLSSTSTLDGHTANDFLRRLGGRTQPTLTPLIDWDAMKAANNGVDVRNINNAGTGIVAYGGDNGFTNGWPAGTIALKQPYTNFDKLYIIASADDGVGTFTAKYETWEMTKLLATGFKCRLVGYSNLVWNVMSSVKNGTTDHYLSTTTLLASGTDFQNCSMVEIYGVNY